MQFAMAQDDHCNVALFYSIGIWSWVCLSAYPIFARLGAQLQELLELQFVSKMTMSSIYIKFQQSIYDHLEFCSQLNGHQYCNLI